MTWRGCQTACGDYSHSDGYNEKRKEKKNARVQPWQDSSTVNSNPTDRLGVKSRKVLRDAITICINRQDGRFADDHVFLWREFPARVSESRKKGIGSIRH